MPKKKNIFKVHNCSLIAIATGFKADTLRKVRNCLVSVPPTSIYYHFWGGHLRPRVVDPEYKGDIAGWVFRSLGYPKLAEELSVIDPIGCDIELLRDILIGAIDKAIKTDRDLADMKASYDFHFLRPQFVFFENGTYFNNPRELAFGIEKMQLNSIFYHFIDCRQRNARNLDDFSVWLLSYGDKYLPLFEEIRLIHPYLKSLEEIRSTLSAVLKGFFRNKPNKK